MAGNTTTKHRSEIPALQGHSCRQITSKHTRLLNICLWGFSLQDLTGKIRRMKKKKRSLTPLPTCSRWTLNYSKSLCLSWEDLRETLVSHICLGEINNKKTAKRRKPIQCPQPVLLGLRKSRVTLLFLRPSHCPVAPLNTKMWCCLVWNKSDIFPPNFETLGVELDLELTSLEKTHLDFVFSALQKAPQHDLPSTDANRSLSIDPTDFG